MVTATELRPALEAILLVADEPVDLPTLARAVDASVGDVEEAVRGLAQDYDDAGRGFELRQVANGWRLYTREAYATVVEQFVLDGQQARLTQAALETLAIVAYRQPVSRARISAIRGVNVEAVMRTLVTRGLVEEAGTDPIGTATLYRTTPYFLERLGLARLDDLPEISAYLPDLESVEDVDV